MTCSMVGRVDDDVGCPLRFPCAQTDEVRIALAGGMQDALEVPVGDVLGAADRLELGADRLG